MALVEVGEYQGDLGHVVTPPSFREDPLLVESLDIFGASLRKGQPRLPIPTNCIDDVLGLPKGWGSADMVSRFLGKDGNQVELWEYDLFERVRERFVATIDPNASRQDAIVKGIVSTDQAEHFLQILSDTRFNRLTQSSQVRIAINGSHPQEPVFHTARQARLAMVLAAGNKANPKAA